LTKSNHENKNHHHFHTHSVVSNIWVAFLLNLFFTIIEFIGGIIFNSSAILADAVHDLGDCFALGSTLFLEKRSLRAENENYSFGYRRLSVLSGMLNGAILLIGASIMLYRAFDRLYVVEEVNSLGMLGMAVLGIVFNGLAIFSMKKTSSNLNARAMYYHLFEDVMGWVIVLIGALAIYFFKLPIIDPILTIGLSIYIGYNAVRLLIPVYYILMESTPRDIDLAHFENDLKSIDHVLDVHDLHIWSLDGNYHLMSAHFTVGKELTKQDVINLREATDNLCKGYNIYHTTIEIEFK